jgi:glycogen debranching enzyme
MLPLRVVLLLGLIFASTYPARSQNSSTSPLHSIDQLPRNAGNLVFHRPVRAGEPFTVPGPQGVIVGQQQGVFEAWILPVKVLSHLTVQADVSGYNVPLDLNTMAREIEVRPDHTTITYSHIAITVRQTMFAPQGSPDGTGVIVVFQIDSVRPATLTVRFTPEMREMWPKRSSGTPSGEWVTAGSSGFYILHTDFPDLAAAIALPSATPGIMAPYQERPQVHPLELVLKFDPLKDRGRAFPLLMAVGNTQNTSTSTALRAKLAELNDHLAALFQASFQAYAKQGQEFTAIETPDAELNADLSWAEISIGQLRARTLATPSQPTGEIGLVAGYYASGDSARPGFGWYFGRDTLFTVYALDSYGDFTLARTALEFILKRQRSDGKIMHEYSQTAAQTDWASLPYEYAAADSTPLLITAILDYVRASGDVNFVRDHRDAINRAWIFETTHDSDGDGVYDNAQGTGWVESWPNGMPKQEIYLALLDEQASAAMAELAKIVGDNATAALASSRATRLHATVEHEYYQSDTDSYAFSRDTAGTLDPTATVFPAVAWWNNGVGLDHPQASTRAWASHDFDTDWGLRDVAESAPIYDPISYHQGSVWPLFTGWAAIAEYRAGHPLAGYQMTIQNADLTAAQEPGAVTELLSGAFFEPFGRSTSHQLWSSAMVATPLLRGTFGIEVDALRHSVKVTPRLPASWDSATVRRIHVGDSLIDLTYRRANRSLRVTLNMLSGPAIHFQDGKDFVNIPLPTVEVSIAHCLPGRGARTQQMKVLDETATEHSLRLETEAPAGSEWTLTVWRNRPTLQIRVEGGELKHEELHVHYPPGSGYVPQVITLSW